MNQLVRTAPSQSKFPEVKKKEGQSAILIHSANQCRDTKQTQIISDTRRRLFPIHSRQVAKIENKGKRSKEMCRGLETDLAKNQRRSDLGTERNTPARNYKIFFDEKEWGQQFMFASTIPFWKERIGSRLNVRSSCCLNCFWGVDSGVLRERDKNIG